MVEIVEQVNWNNVQSKQIIFNCWHCEQMVELWELCNFTVH